MATTRRELLGAGASAALGLIPEGMRKPQRRVMPQARKGAGPTHSPQVCGGSVAAVYAAAAPSFAPDIADALVGDGGVDNGVRD